MELNKTQLLLRYDITLKTLDLLVSRDLFEGKFENKDGKRVINLTPKDEFTLESARNLISSFGIGSVVKGSVKGIHPMPFHRFMVMRMVNTSVEELYEEIFQLDLLESKQKFPLKNLIKIRDRFISRLPDSMKDMVTEGRPPANDKEKEDLGLFLDIHSVKSFYDDPGRIESLMFLISVRKQVEVFLSTISTSEEIASALSSRLGFNLPGIYVNAYRLLFYSIYELSGEDMEVYLMSIVPTESRLKKSAMKMTVDRLVISQGMDVKDTTKTMMEMLEEAQKDVFNLRALKTPEARQAQRAALDRFLKIADTLKEKLGDISAVASVFDRFKTKMAEQGDIISLEEVRVQSSAGGS
jgi:hypothetical protein